jgi:hypothetical protein
MPEELAQHYLVNVWKTLSVPRGQSEPFNQKMIELLKNKKDEADVPIHLRGGYKP